MEIIVSHNFILTNKCKLTQNKDCLHNNNINTNNIIINSVPNFGYYNTLLSFKGIYNAKKKNNCKNDYNHFAGCIMGGAIGDAFGAPVEFMKLKRIKREYGENGLSELTFDKKRGKIDITDDTQLSMFTADGILRSFNTTHKELAQPNYKVMFDSYRNWYKMCALSQKVNQNWLTKQDKLLSTGGSGKTCMSVLAQDKMGTIKEPINNSKGAGGVMRVAPIGLYYSSAPKSAFAIAAKSAALTHGHSDAFLSAGVYATILAYIINGYTIEESVYKSLEILKTKKNGKSLYNNIVNAINLAHDNSIDTINAIEKLGKGWNGDEAITIAIYVAIKNQNNYKQAIIDAVNHDGDSDTVGSIAGGIVGCYVGWNNIPDEYKGKIELEKELLELSNDLLLKPNNIRNFSRKYKL